LREYSALQSLRPKTLITTTRDVEDNHWASDIIVNITQQHVDDAPARIVLLLEWSIVVQATTPLPRSEQLANVRPNIVYLPKTSGVTQEALHSLLKLARALRGRIYKRGILRVVNCGQ